jgi:hypothetical protein
MFNNHYLFFHREMKKNPVTVMMKVSISLYYSRPEYSWKIARWTLSTNQSINHYITYISERGCHGPDHMVVGFITTYAVSAYHH